MDLPGIAAIAAPFVAKGAEVFSKTVGDELGGLVADLCQSVADKFKGDASAQQALAAAQEKPDSKARQTALQAAIAEKMEDDADFAKEIQRLVKTIKKEGRGSVFDQRGQTVNGPQTNIAGGVQGTVFSGEFKGPVSMGGDASIINIRSKDSSDHKSSKKVKALFLASNPKGTKPLELDREIREITEKIRAAEYRDSIDLISAWAVRPDDLLQLFNQHKPQIVHFSGHGSESGEIILVDSRGEPKPVNPAAIKALFQTLKGSIRLVILNACYSKIQAEAITQVVDCAIGMNDSIGDEAAIAFAASFYRAIGFGLSVTQAFDQGIVVLLLEGIPEESKPELLIKDGVDPEKIVLISSKNE